MASAFDGTNCVNKTGADPVSSDSWIRMRLRSILRKRRRRTGRGSALDRFRWPNAYFRKLGLFSLAAAHAAACQSSRR